MERVREICVRSLFKVVWLASDRASRVGVGAFIKAMKMQGVELGLQGVKDEDVSMGEMDALDETECIITTMIYKVSPLPKSMSNANHSVDRGI